jgi:O-antigen ligase
MLRRVVRVWLLATAVSVAACAAGVVLFYAGLRDAAQNPVLSHLGSLPPGAYPRLRGLFDNANMFCTYLVASVVLVVVAAALGWIRARSAAALAVGVMVAALCTISPGLGGMALVVGALVRLWTRGTLRAWVGRVALAVGGLLAAVATLLTAVSLAPPYWPPAPSPRWLTWKATLATIARHPLLGTGVGTDACQVAHRVPDGTEQWLTDAHNAWLSVAAQEGLIGLCAFTALVVWLLRRPWPLTRRGDPVRVAHSGLWLAFVGGFVYQTLSGSFEDTRHVWVLMGLVAATRSEGFA